MANTLTDLAPKLLAQGLMALRGSTVMAPLVNTSYSDRFAEKGTTVDVPIPSAVAVQDVTPSNTPPSTADQTLVTVPITLDQWKEAPFYLTDKDMQQAMRGVIPMQASESIKAIVETINAKIFDQYKSFYGYFGVAGVTPLASDTSEATGVRKILNQQLAPLGDRRLVMDPDMEANALDLRAFQDASFSGTPMTITEGQILRKLGFNWFMDQQVPTHTAGTITTGAIAKAATGVALGEKVIVGTTAASTGAIDWFVGDIILFAGDTQTYVITAAVAEATASTDFTFNIEPGLKQALVGSEAITIKGDHVVNFAFHRDAIAFVSRPLTDNDAGGLGNIIQAVADPMTRIALRLEISREHKRTRFSYDLLYGAKAVRLELAARLAG